MEDSLSNQSKVNRICNAFLTVLEKHLSNNLQNVITANLCKSPPDIEAGLRVVLSLDGSNESLVDTAIEHICFLADTNKIYEIALGMYKLDLALLIAQQSQKVCLSSLPMRSHQLIAVLRTPKSIFPTFKSYKTSKKNLAASFRLIMTWAGNLKPLHIFMAWQISTNSSSIQKSMSYINRPYR